MFKAHRLLYYSTLGSRVMKKKEDKYQVTRLPSDDSLNLQGVDTAREPRNLTGLRAPIS